MPELALEIEVLSFLVGTLSDVESEVIHCQLSAGSHDKIKGEYK